MSPTEARHRDGTPRPDGLRLTVLGCSGSYPGAGRACSGYLLQSPAATVLVDLGPGVLGELQRHVPLDGLDALVLSHEHPDHWIETPSLRVAMRYYLRLEGLPVYGTGGTRDLVEAVVGDPAPTLAWTTIDAGSTVRVGDLALRFSRTDHPVESLAVRVDHGGGAARSRSLVYSADTGPGWRAGDLAAGTDLLLCEATVPASEEVVGMLHLSGRQAGEKAAACGAGRLVLTHIAPGVDPGAQRRDARAAFTGPVDLAVPGATFRV